MFIGKLNDRLKDLSFECFISKTKTAPETVKDGNPLFGDTYEISWKFLLENSACLHVHWQETQSINNVLLELGEDCAPKCIRVFTEDGRSLCEHHAETGCSINQKRIALPLEAELCGFIIEMDSEFSSIIINNIELYGADFEGEKLFPEPFEYTKKDGFVNAENIKTVSFEGECGQKAFTILCEKWEELTKSPLRNAKSADISLIYDKNIADNGYNLFVSQNEIIIKACDIRGMVYGCEVLLKLIEDGRIPCCEIEDRPRFPFRGVHLMMPPIDEFDFTKRLVKYMLSPMGYNNIILELGGAMEYKKHPEINEAVREATQKGKDGIWPPFPHGELGDGETVPQELIKDLIDYCRSFGIEVIPEIQSLGHVQFMTLAHPEIAELAEDAVAKEGIDTRDADALPADFYAHSYCPENPKSYELLFDIIDEVLEVFAPIEYVHMGHDEVYQLGICPICKNKDRGELFASDINKIYDYLKARGVKMMIWSDMIQTVPTYRHRAIGSTGKIPKDIICLDFIWYFNLPLDIEVNLLSEGFKVAFGNLYSSHFPRYEKRAAKDGIIGGQTSTWVTTREEDIAREGKMYDIIMTSQMLWSEKYTSLARFSYDKLIRKMMPQMREKISGRVYPSLKDGADRRVIAKNEKFYPEITKWQKEFSVNTKAESLIFKHTATKKIMRYPWLPNDVIGQYTISYEDGSTQSIPVTYAGILTHYARRQGQPFSHKYYRHNGYTATYFSDAEERRLTDGSFCTLYSYEWINPYPNKSIIKIEYIGNNEFDTDTYIEQIEAIF
ncbi:MAG: family 20 glycosylhydrolase [Clostridia bacterium]|nr:family 20 glycosylhydrolase [Clostridia bacterium]